MFEVEYLTDQNGKPKAVVIPIDLWRRLLPQADDTELSEADLVEAIEDYCLKKAMDEAQDSLLLDREAALEESK